MKTPEEAARICPLVPFSVDDLRQRLQLRTSPVAFTGDAMVSDLHLGRQPSDQTVWKKAAVLVPVYEKDGTANILLTRRSTHLRDHSGQVAFPGGKIEASDLSVEDAALREAEEEIGLARQHVDIIGHQPPYYTGTGYEVMPIIGVVGDVTNLQANQDEVDVIFSVPLVFLMDAANYQLLYKEIKGEKRRFYTLDYQGFTIWGATAGMLRAIYERLYR